MYKCFPFLKACGRHIDFIDKRHCSLVSVPDDVLRSARTLEECHLDANQIKDFPRNFFRLERLRLLTLSDNELSRIPPAIGNFTVLAELDLSRNEICELPSNIKFCDALQVLDISNNPLHRLPDGFSQLRNLRNLNINDISIAELPSDFGNLSNLQRLELRDNCLKNLPNSFPQLKRLEFLDLGGNEFHTLPPLIGELTALTDLFLDGNELKELPPEMGHLKHLQQLDASENFLEYLPEEIAGMAALTDLTLSQNSLDTLPNGIGHLKKLTVLKVDQNQLITLTTYIGSCSGLQELYLTENFLSQLPNSIGGLSSLFHLNVDRNRLMDLPNEIGRCSKLSILSLRNNRLRRLPKEVGKITQLHVLDVSGNKLDRLPSTISQCQLKALWLSENQAQPIVKLQKDVDEMSGEEFLTCYLLPQEAFETESMENFLEPSTTGVDLQQDDISPDPDLSRVRFSGDEDKHTEAGKNFPKEPKMRHPKFDKKAVDGHIIPKDATHSKELKFAPGRATPPPNMDGTSDEEFAFNSELDAVRTRKISGYSGRTPSGSTVTSEYVEKRAPPQSNPRTAVSVVTGIPHDLSLDGIRSRSKSDTTVPAATVVTKSQPSPGAAAAAKSAAAANVAQTRPTITSQTAPKKSPPARKSTSSGEESSSEESSSEEESSSGPSDNEKEKKVTLPPAPTQTNPGVSIVVTQEKKPRGGVTIADAPPVEIRFEERVDGDENDEGGEEITYSSGGEEIDIISRHVGFSEDVEDNEEKSIQKLIRRDTPHYTKRARIQQKTADGVDSEEAVLSILDKYRTPSGTAVAPPQQWIRPVEVSTTASTPPGHPTSPLTPGNQSSPLGADVQEERLDLHISRQQGQGLGISIAGGIGSMPYRDNDQGIFISKVSETGPTAKAGLRVADKLIAVNGVDLLDVEHQKAVLVLRNAGNEIDMSVIREVIAPVEPPPELDKNLEIKHERIRCSLERDENGLGFSIAGGRGSLPKEVQDERWAFLESIYISKITEGGAAQKCGLLEIGDKVIKINNTDVSEARHDDAVNLLIGNEPAIELELLREQVMPRDQVGEETAERVNGEVTQPAVAMPLEVIRIRKNNGPLGLSICGGSDHNSHPFGIEEPGVFISKIIANGAASNTNLHVGDRILSVNGRDVTKAKHEEAVLALVEPPREIILEVRHDPPPPGMRELTITKSPTAKLGISIQGGVGNTSANPSDSTDEGIFISRVLPDGAVGKDARVKLGDRLLEVNGHNLLGASRQEAIRVLREVSDSITVVVCDGIPEDRVLEAFGRPRLTSSTSVDREDEMASLAAEQGGFDLDNAFEDNNPTDGKWRTSESSSSTRTSYNSRYQSTTTTHKTVEVTNDPIRASRLPSAGRAVAGDGPSAKVGSESGGDAGTDLTHLSFRSKRSYFEREIERAASPPRADSGANNNKAPSSQSIPAQQRLTSK